MGVRSRRQKGKKGEGEIAFDCGWAWLGWGGRGFYYCGTLRSLASSRLAGWLAGREDVDGVGRVGGAEAVLRSGDWQYGSEYQSYGHG